MKKCCSKYDIAFTDGAICGQSSPLRYKYIECKSCGKKTSGKTEWYHADGVNEVEICEALIKEWNDSLS